MGATSVQDGVDLLVNAMKILVYQLDQKEVKCTVIGDGDALPLARQLSSQFGLESHIDFTGYIYDREIVKRYMHEADICLEPAPYSEANSRSTFIKIMEYMACGKPIVAFDLDETRASVGDAAILIEPGNLTEFARGVQDLLADPQKRKVIGNRAYSRIVNHLNWEKSADTLKRIYDRIL